MFQQMLVPLDGSKLSEQILPHVVALAKGLKISLMLVHVVDTGPFSLSPEADPRPVSQRTLAEAQKRARSYLETIQARLRAEGVEAATDVAVGPSAQVILSLTEAHRANLIAMSTHSLSGITLWMIGSVAHRVLQTTPLPLLLFRPSEGEAPDSVQLRRLLVPLDGSELAEEALPVAESLARALDMRVELFRAIPLHAFALYDIDAPGSTEQGEDLVATLEHAAADYLDKQSQALRARGIRVETRLVRGDPATQLVDLTNQNADTLTVMSTHGRSGSRPFVLGSVADKVARSSANPVLVISPETTILSLSQKEICRQVHSDEKA